MTVPLSNEGRRQPGVRGGLLAHAAPGTGLRARLLAALLVVGILACDGTTEPVNEAPHAVGTIPDLEVQVDSVETVDVAGYFADPDGDTLRYAAQTSDVTRATVTMVESTVTVSGVAAGAAMVTVTATDSEGLSAEQIFGVAVPNREPVAVGTIEDLEVEVDSVVVVEVAGYFADPDGDALAYAAVSSDSTRATVAIVGDTVTVTGVAKGSVTVAVTATDVEGLSVEQSFGVRVPNRAPVALGAIADLEVEVDSAVVVEVMGYFADPDGDELSFTAVSLDSTRATVVVVGDTVTVIGVAKGSATVTVTATDPEGLTAEQSFGVAVPNRAPVTVGTIAELEVEVDSAAVVEIAGYFADPDGDSLEYEAVSSDSKRAAVAVVGDTVTVMGVAKGNLTVTVTATDPEGLSAELHFGVKVPNRVPVVVGGIAGLEVEVDSVAAVEVAAYFTDPDGDSLEYSASSSDATRASIAVTGNTLAVTGVAKGSAAVTVVAQDPEGLFAQQSFVVTVPNRAPEAAGTIADLEVQVDSAAAVDVAVHFTDPDGDPLEYSVTSSDPTRAMVTVTGSVVTVAGVAKGRVTISVAAQDPEGLVAEQHFAVTVPNRAPEAVGAITDLVAWADGPVAVDVTAYFADPDGDVLAYTAVSSDTSRATVAVTGSTVTVTGVARGSATMTATATDPEGLSAEQSFAVTVPNRAPETVGSIRNRVVESGKSFSVDASLYFDDPDGDDLEYSATSSSRGRATVRVSGSTVTVTGRAGGTATITVTAEDSAGLTAEQSFRVTVPRPNRSPQSAGRIPNRTAAVNTEISVDVSPYFTDPDGDQLRYSATSSNTAVATASASNSTVTVAAAAAGTATITVTARDPGGLGATQRFRVTVRGTNRGPRAVGTIPDRTVVVNADISLDVSPYFTDPDGDALEYSATSSNTTVATVGTSNSTVTLTGEAVGTATITVTARDPSGLAATQRFSIAVRATNQSPRTVGTIPDQTVEEGEEMEVDAESYFTDPDGDQLDYSAISSRTAIATVDVSGSTVDVKGQQNGTATITVTAEDPSGLTATQRFEVTVEELPNRAPVVVNGIDDLLDAAPGEIWKLTLTRVFADPDGDLLTYSTSSTNSAVAEPEIKGDTIFLTILDFGSATITVTATDPEGLSATAEFEVTVVMAPERFDILLGFTDDVTETQKSRIGAAGRAWESILRDTELADVTATGAVECLGLVASNVGTVDDHLVLIDVRAEDGPSGTLAYASFCYVRTSDGTPLVSAAVFDEADIDRMVSLGSLPMVAFHEFAHALGFTDDYWVDFNLVDTGLDPHFTGALAIAAFDAAGGTGYTDSKVPISSPDYAHWRESEFGLEGMTSVLTLGVTNPFSAITLQAMADVGYLVDASLADDYQLPGTVPPDLAGDEAAQVLDLSNDVVRGPVMVIGSDGRVERVIPAPPGSVVPRWPRREVQIERGGARDRQTEAGRAVPARQTMWQRVIRPAPSGRPR